MVSWLGRLREDHRNGHWSDWLELIPGFGTMAHIIRGIGLIFKGDSK